MSKKKINKLKNIYFLGNKINPYKYLKKSDLFILSSKWEGMPNVILEALYLGKRVVCLDVDYGPRELASSFEGLVVVPKAQSTEFGAYLLRGLESSFRPNPSTKMTFVKRFSTPVVVNQYVNAILGVIRGL